MNNYKNRHRILIKTIAMAVVCLFTINTVSWAHPDFTKTASSATLAPQSIFKPLKDEGIESSAELEFQLIAGVRLLLAGKHVTEVNGILGGTAKKIDFLKSRKDPEKENAVMAKFKVQGKDDVIFEISYRDTETTPGDENVRDIGDDISVKDAVLDKISPIDGLHYGNIFQQNDEIVITKLREEDGQLNTPEANGNEEKYPGIIDELLKRSQTPIIFSTHANPERKYSIHIQQEAVPNEALFLLRKNIQPKCTINVLRLPERSGEPAYPVAIVTGISENEKSSVNLEWVIVLDYAEIYKRINEFGERNQKKMTFLDLMKEYFQFNYESEYVLQVKMLYEYITSDLKIDTEEGARGFFTNAPRELKRNGLARAVTEFLTSFAPIGSKLCLTINNKETMESLDSGGVYENTLHGKWFGSLGYEVVQGIRKHEEDYPKYVLEKKRLPTIKTVWEDPGVLGKHVVVPEPSPALKSDLKALRNAIFFFVYQFLVRHNEKEPDPEDEITINKRMVTYTGYKRVSLQSEEILATANSHGCVPVICQEISGSDTYNHLYHMPTDATPYGVHQSPDLSHNFFDQFRYIINDNQNLIFILFCEKKGLKTYTELSELILKKYKNSKVLIVYDKDQRVKGAFAMTEGVGLFSGKVRKGNFSIPAAGRGAKNVALAWEDINSMLAGKKSLVVDLKDLTESDFSQEKPFEAKPTNGMGGADFSREDEGRIAEEHKDECSIGEEIKEILRG
ncbi:MAG: hypothetical protein PHW46_05490, partial [Candidatus Omnitrophica bacterium]|nr:hypothetical protein [Candidatus Omnitrophota bacterium]